MQNISHYDLKELLENFAELEKIQFYPYGVWNAPKDIKSFDIRLPTRSSSSNVTEGESKWRWLGCSNTPLNPKLEFKVHEHNSNHLIFEFDTIFDILIQKNIIPKNELISIQYKW